VIGLRIGRRKAVDKSINQVAYHLDRLEEALWWGEAYLVGWGTRKKVGEMGPLRRGRYGQGNCAESCGGPANEGRWEKKTGG